MPRSIKDAIASGSLKTFMDRRLIEALGHPVREHVLAVVNERPASASEIAREIDVDVADFHHHVESLARRGFLELVESRQRRGSKERFFRARETVLFDDQMWAKIPASIRSDMVVGHLRSILDELVSALLSGAFRARQTHTTWLPAVFDKRGWRECMDLLNETLVRVMEIQARSGERIAASGETGIPGTIALLGFANALRRAQSAS